MILPKTCGNFYGKSRLNSENATVIYFGFLNGSRHLVGTDVKEILEIPYQCWLFQDSFSFLITRRSRGSNPVSATKKDSIVDIISAMEFCFICSMPYFCPFTAHFGGFEGVFSFRNNKSAILCPTKTEVADFVSFKE